MVLVITVACIGAIAESLTQGWEFWVPPLIGVGVVVAWWMHISQYGSERGRENYYMIFSMLVSFYHGVHWTSFFDVIVISALLMSTATLIKRIMYLRLIMIEFFLTMSVQIIMALSLGTIHFDTLTISRVLLHIIGEICIYSVLKTVADRGLLEDDRLKAREDEKKQYDHDMEDFLVNISHELRTPVNVINGLSGLILRKENREDIASISDAGRRLAHQIEDIQDYSEIQRKNVVIENERYMITSLLTDLLAAYRPVSERNGLEYIVDLDPTVPAALKGDPKKIYKIMEHLMNNAFKFTRQGGARIRISALKKDYGINLILEVSDTGIGMTQKDIEGVSNGIYQADRKRDRRTGGIGLGLSIVYGLVRSMNGFVKIESEPGRGTTVRVSVFQEVVDKSPCMSARTDRFINAVFYIQPDKYKVPALGEFYRDMARTLSRGLRVNLYIAQGLHELEKLLARGDMTHVFMGAEEYFADRNYIESISESGVCVAVSAPDELARQIRGNVIFLSKPIYGMQIVNLINEVAADEDKDNACDNETPLLAGIRALVCDDEPMNLVVAKGLFKEYRMYTDTVESGKEAVERFRENDYDVIFMDHMMPEMDGVETMKRIRAVSEQENRPVKIIALTANAVSGAKEMFLSKGFDGFISKPITISDFERVMNRVMKDVMDDRKRGTT